MSRDAVDTKLILNAPKSVGSLVDLLVEGMGWPRPDDMDEIPLVDWTPEDLGLKTDELGRLVSFKQVPRLTGKQPFGVFVLEFDGGRLPIGTLRRLVNQMIVKKKSHSKKTAANLWGLGDLVFFCHTEENAGTVHIVAFNEESGKREIRAISWTTEPTPTRLDLLAKHALADLAWPAASVSVDEWRAQWHGAFTAGYRQGVKTAAQLSQRMAEVAIDIRRELSGLLLVEADDSPLRQLLADVRETLDANMDEDRFADMFAQTIVYGLLSSRISNPERFKAAESLALVDFENPLLEAIYTRFLKEAAAEDALDLDHLGLEDLTHTLALTDVDALLADFGARDRRDDPVIYLYEEFLERYDRQQRKDLGAYYTPTPVVSAMVRLVDEILTEDLGFGNGIVDQTTWADWLAAHPDVNLPDGIGLSDPVLRMIDPATGTGTYLLEWLRVALGKAGADASATLKQMSAIEISLASYSVAHLKTGLELPPGIRASAPLPIYLGDTLAGERKQHLTGLEDPLSREAAQTEELKFKHRHSIVIGNPPYQRLEKEGSGGWITTPEVGASSLFDDVLRPAIEHTIFSYTASLYNLYVYFWRWAIWKAFEQTPDGPAIVAFITASSWLDGPGFLGLRELARRQADDIWIVDLGGDNHGAVKDENVFPIETPVAIVILARHGARDVDTPAVARYQRIEGTREEKLAQLQHVSRNKDVWTDLKDGWFDRLKPSAGGDDWERLPLLTDLIPWQQPGCMVNRTWPIAPQAELLTKRWQRFVGIADEAAKAVAFVTGKTGRTIHTRVGGLRALADEPRRASPPPIAPYGFRSYDQQLILDDPRLLNLDRPSLWSSVSQQQVFLVTTPTSPLGGGPAASVFTGVPDKHAYNGRGGKDVFPLYRDAGQTPNTDPRALEYVHDQHVDSDPKAPKITPEAWFSYIYGVLSGTDYTERFAEALTTPGPRVPITADATLFQEMSEHGARLIWLHTKGDRFASNERAKFSVLPAIRWHRKPARIPMDTNDFAYDEATSSLRVADGQLMGVSPDVWAFQVSGMAVVKKWLGYRTAKGTGKAASSKSPLDQIRPDRWYDEWNEELRELISILQTTLDSVRPGNDILDRILEGPLIAAQDLPEPPAHLREVPRTAGGQTQDTLDV